MKCINCGRKIKSGIECKKCKGWEKGLSPRDIVFKLESAGHGGMPTPEINR